MVTSLGATTRKGEEKEMTDVLITSYNHLEYVTPSGTLKGGDVMMAGDHFILAYQIVSIKSVQSK